MDRERSVALHSSEVVEPEYVTLLKSSENVYATQNSQTPSTTSTEFPRFPTTIVSGNLQKRSDNAFNKKGRYFGYPQCCIDQFIRNFEKRVRVGAVNKKAAKGHGFIPCDAHSLQIINKQIKLGDLIHERVCETAFPNDNGSAIVEQRLKRRFRMVMMEIRSHKNCIC